MSTSSMPPPRPFRIIPPPGPPPRRQRNGIGTASLVLGILNFFCLPIIGAVLAVAFGKAGIDRARRGEASNLGIARAGFWLGWAGLVLSLIGFAVGFFLPQIIGSVIDTNVNSRTGLANGTYLMYPSSWIYAADHCAGSGPDVRIGSSELVASNVAISGEGSIQCGGLRQPSQVMFTVTGGVATINSVAR
jgi:hypothetical protein